MRYAANALRSLTPARHAEAFRGCATPSMPCASVALPAWTSSKAALLPVVWASSKTAPLAAPWPQLLPSSTALISAPLAAVPAASPLPTGLAWAQAACSSRASLSPLLRDSVGSSAERSTTSGSVAVAAWLLFSLPVARPVGATGGLISLADSGALSAWRLRTNQSDTCRQAAPQCGVVAGVPAVQNIVTAMSAPQPSTLSMGTAGCFSQHAEDAALLSGDHKSRKLPQAPACL